MKHKLSRRIISIFILIISACNATPQVTELSSETISYDETISINNCGNKAESTQTTSRSFSTRISGTGTIKAGYDKIIEGSVSTTYEQFRNTTKAQSLTAAPETNMEFVIRWSDDVRTGNVIVNGESADFTVNIPISVAQVSSRDLGCDDPVSTSETPESTIAFSDSFDGSNSNYDETLWICGKECNIENVSLKDGKLNLQRTNEGSTYLISRSKWDYSDLDSLRMDFQISSDLTQGALGWLSIHDLNNNVIGCGIHGTEAPYIQCDIHDYVTQQQSINFDTWYSIEIDFDQNSNSIKYYFENTLIGEYTLINNPDKMQVDTGIYSPINTPTGRILVDDIILTLNN